MLNKQFSARLLAAFVLFTLIIGLIAAWLCGKMADYLAWVMQIGGMTLAGLLAVLKGEWRADKRKDGEEDAK